MVICFLVSGFSQLDCSIQVHPWCVQGVKEMKNGFSQFEESGASDSLHLKFVRLELIKVRCKYYERVFMHEGLLI